MRKIEAVLTRAGYKVVNQGYRSRSDCIENLALEAISEALYKCRPHSPDTIHFVTHSMGGILLRYYLKQHKISVLGNTVMLCPPNQGSEVADWLRHFVPFQWLNGPAGLQLGTGHKCLPRQLGEVDYPVGVITGNRYNFYDIFFRNLFKGEHDGKVSVKSARLQGMKDFLVVNQTHTFVMNSEQVIKQILIFLEQQSFQHEDG